MATASQASTVTTLCLALQHAIRATAGRRAAEFGEGCIRS
jgi:hypothetical protein